MEDRQIVENMYKELAQASIDRNLEKLDILLADEYVLVHMTGMHQSKKDYMNSVNSGELKYYDLVHESIEVKLNGDKAEVIGKTKTLASPFGSSKSWWRLRQDMKFEKRNNRWYIVYSKASMY